MYSRGIFVVLLTITVVIKTSEACSCLPCHPQEHFCKSDFVILATVKREFTQEYSKIYKVRIRKEFKMSEKAKIALKSGRLFTPRYGSLCGVNLDLKKTYVITGRINGLQAHISLCGFKKPWSEVSHRQRKGFKLLYGRGCDCKTRQCRTSCSANDICPWSYHSQCQTDHGICLKNANGKCHWTKSLALKKCQGGHKKTETTTTESALSIPDPFRLPERVKEVSEEPRRTEENRYQKVGYYQYNKVSN